MKFSEKYRVAPEDIDEHGHVNNVAYLRWIQDVAVSHWKTAAPPEMLQSYTWFVVRHEIDYKSRVFCDDEVVATTWVGDAGRIKCFRYTKIEKGGEICVSAKSTWCVVNAETLRPTRITDEMVEIFNMNR